MTTVDHDRLRDLSPAKRALLLKRLAERGPGRVEGDGPFPVSYDQERMWLLDRMSEPGAYNVARVLHVRGDLDVARLEDALAALVARHEALRTIYGRGPDGVVQTIGPPTRPTVEVLDLRAGGDACDPDERAATVRRLERQAVVDRFDLAGGLLVRVRALRLADREWRVVVAVHHLASDETSSAVFFSELAALYGDPAVVETLPAIEHRAADFAVWQRQQLQGERLQQLLDHWTAHLGGAPDVLELPGDRARPSVSSGRGDRTRLPLDPALIDRVEAFAREAGVTRFTVVLAAAAELLRRLSGQDDVVIGTPVAGRHHAGFERVLGCFTNTLALRVDGSGDPSGRELVDRVRQALLGGLAHQDLPFQRLVDELDPTRSSAVSPVFQAMVVQQDQRTADAAGLPGLDVTVEISDPGTAKLDFLISLAASPTGWDLVSEFSTDLFDEATVRRWLGWYVRLLDGLVADADRPVAAIPLLDAAEQAELVRFGTGTVAAAPAHLASDAVARRARTHPDALAVADADTKLTYGELDDRSRQLARWLIARGIGRGDLVGVFLERRAQLVVALHGIVRAGAAYVPLEPSYPADRLRVILDDARPGVVVTQDTLAADLRATGTDARLLCLDGDGAEIAAAPEAALPTVAPEDRAYVIFTSGSTGRPKGVELPHRALANLLDSLAATPGIGPDDVLVGVTTPAFDLSVPDWFLPAWVGAQLVVVGPEVALDGRALGQLLGEVGASVLDATPATWRMLLASGWTGSPRLRAWCGGEAWDGALAGPLLERVGELWNMYGPTETCVWSAARRVGPGEPVRIGGPVRNTTITLLDGRLQPVLPGAPGELCIGGDGVALGYFERPDLTADRFVPTPDGSGRASGTGGPDGGTGTSGTGGPGGGTGGTGRVYRTGDLARWRPDGTIEFLGRLDHQVKLRGFRIELGEIETALVEHPAVGQAIAVVRDDLPGGPALVAYVCGSGPESVDLDPTELRRLVGRSLPGYMVPSAVVVLAEFPLTPNGKVDRRRLPVPERGPDRDHVAPRTEVERRMLAVWQKVLGPGEISVEAGFFDVGGHSLVAVQLFDEIEAEFDTRFPLSTIFQNASIAELAAAVAQPSAPGQRFTSLVMLQRGAGATGGEGVLAGAAHVFLAPWVSGEVLGFRPLVANLPDAWDVHGLQSPGLDRKSYPFRRIEQSATHFVDAIVQQDPDGPYVIGGFCWGGIVALEICQQLVARGKTVELLVLFDTNRTAQHANRAERERAIRSRYAVRHGRNPLRYFKKRAWDGTVKAYRIAWWKTYDHFEAKQWPLPRILANVRRVNERSGKYYTAGPAPCPVLILRRGTEEQIDSYYSGPFRDHMANVHLDIRVVAPFETTSHLAVMREPVVRVVAAEVAAAVDRSRARRLGAGR